jgi:hypothetical protein
VKEGALCEFSNNVVYNYRKYPSDFDAVNGRANCIGNYYVPGPFTHGDGGSNVRGVIIGSNNTTVYVRDNRAIGGMGHDDAGCPGSDQDTCRGNPQEVTAVRPQDGVPETDVMGTAGALGPSADFAAGPARFDEMPHVTYSSVEENLNTVVAHFGAWPRDNTDKRLVDELKTRTGAWKLYRYADHNSYAGTAEPDADHDGIPDAWEQARGGDLSPNGHDLHDQYDNIEIYLQHRMEDLLSAATVEDIHEILTGEPAPVRIGVLAGMHQARWRLRRCAVGTERIEWGAGRGAMRVYDCRGRLVRPEAKRMVTRPLTPYRQSQAAGGVRLLPRE